MFRVPGQHRSVSTPPLTNRTGTPPAGGSPSPAGASPAAAGAGPEGPDRSEPAGRRRRRRWPWVLLAGVLLVALLIGGGVAWVYSLPMPNPHPQLQATLVYGADGQVIGEFAEQNRVDVPLSAVPQVVIDAVVSTEDRHFFTEGALNPVSTVRAAIADITGSGGLQGGSTITQQYVKQAYLSPKRTITRKIREAAVAYRLAQKQSKKQILDEYLNTIYWGRGAYGIEAAAQAYFGRNVGQLNVAEAALLAGLIREPETADPAHDPALARRNQTESLNAMVRDHKITRAQEQAALAAPLSSYVIAPGGTGSSNSAHTGTDYFLAAVRAELYQKYGRQMVDGGGLRVTTTLDPTLQSEAYNSLYGKSANALDPAKGDPSAALVSVDDQGRVRALVGGQDYARNSVDLALGSAGGGSGRQAGSTFKAFMLAAAIKAGYSVQSPIPAPPKVVIPDGSASGNWTVTNYEGEAVAPTMNLIDATALSVNTVYAQVVETIGADKLDAMAESMGISPKELAHPYLSQVLGTAAVSPLEMAAAYSTFADGGVYHQPLLITKVTTAKGKVLPLPVTPQARRVLTPDQAAVADYVLSQVVARGTGTAAGGVGSAVAGKTGTTDTAGDAWFDGYTPQLATAVWMGYANSEKSMDGFRGITSLAGGTIPAEMWHDYMAAALASEPQLAGTFPAPASLGGKMLIVGNQQLPVPTTAPGYSTTVPPVTAPPTTLFAPTPTSPPTTLLAPTPTAPPATAAPTPTTAPAPTTTSPPTTVAPAPTTTATTAPVQPATAAPTTTTPGG